MEMTQRAIELLNLPEDRPCYLLDLGCGSGLSGEELTDAGHMWVGLDVSSAMLSACPLVPSNALRINLTRIDIAREREVEGDLFLHDLGEGVGFRPGVFDGAIRCSPNAASSISPLILIII